MSQCLLLPWQVNNVTIGNFVLHNEQKVSLSARLCYLNYKSYHREMRQACLYQSQPPIFLVLVTELYQLFILKSNIVRTIKSLIRVTRKVYFWNIIIITLKAKHKHAMTSPNNTLLLYYTLFYDCSFLLNIIYTQMKKFTN